MKTSRELKNPLILGIQLSLVILFYIFATGVFTFLWYAVYRSIVHNDHPAHAVILASIISFAFLILTSVMTMIFFVTIREGHKNVVQNGGSTDEGSV